MLEIHSDIPIKCPMVDITRRYTEPLTFKALSLLWS